MRNGGKLECRAEKKAEQVEKRLETGILARRVEEQRKYENVWKHENRFFLLENATKGSQKARKGRGEATPQKAEFGRSGKFAYPPWEKRIGHVTDKTTTQNGGNSETRSEQLRSI